MQDCDDDPTRLTSSGRLANDIPHSGEACRQLCSLWNLLVSWTVPTRAGDYTLQAAHLLILHVKHEFIRAAVSSQRKEVGPSRVTNVVQYGR